MKLIGLTGYARSGKDAAASFLVERGWKRLAFADAVRAAALAIDPLVIVYNDHDVWSLSEFVKHVGWDVAKQHPEVRRLLQRIGTEAGRDIHGDHCWVDIVRRQLEQLPAKNVVITDVRFKEEADFIRSYHHDGVIIRIAKPGVGPVNDHKSDTAIDRIQEDSWIANDGTLEDLKRKILKAAHVAEGA